MIGIELKIDKCPGCGASGNFPDCCPNCGDIPIRIPVVENSLSTASEVSDRELPTESNAPNPHDMTTSESLVSEVAALMGETLEEKGACGETTRTPGGPR